MKILICDDEDLIRRSLARAFKSIPHEVFEAENGLQALHVLKTEKIDLLILDLLMPEKNGFDVLDEMDSKIPVVIISAFSGQQQGQFETEKYPQVISYIKKPFDEIFKLTSEIIQIYENHIRKI